MRTRQLMNLYQTAARIWLTAAVFALLLPPDLRLEWWVPLHLVLVGAVSVAISGAMQYFTGSLTATEPPPGWMAWTQFGFVNVGAALVVAGGSFGHPGLLGIGGTAFLAGIALLGVIVMRASRRALQVRYRVPVAMYLGAVTCVLVGGAIGILLGTDAVHGARAHLDLESAHMVVNLLGWVSLTITGTLVTLLPAVLRVRMPAWAGGTTGALFGIGVAVTTIGLALGVTPVAVAGAIAFAAAVAGLLVMVRRVLSTQRKWPVPVSAKHLLLALGWFAFGTVWLVVELIRGIDVFGSADDLFVVVFAGGWTLQTLLGAWLYLLPMARPSHPDERRGFLAAVEWGGTLQVVGLNAGLVLLMLAVSGVGSTAVARIGSALALFGVVLALAKAWAFPLLGRSDFFTRGSRAMWNPLEHVRDRETPLLPM